MVDAMSLAGKTLFVTGASRGIGKAIAVRAARDGANVAIAAKTVKPHRILPGTIHTAAQEIEQAGGRALACQVDVRFEEQIEAGVQAAVEAFGGIDIVVNNAGAIALTGTVETEPRRFDLMHAINVRATYLTSRACVPHLREAANPHILNLSPPLDLDPQWFARHLAYTLSKYGMSMCVIGMAEEFRPDGIAVNALWPQTVIGTAAVRNLLGGEAVCNRARKPEIMGDAAHAILCRDSREVTGRFFTDEQALAEAGVTDLEHYSVTPGAELIGDLFVDRDAYRRYSV